MKGSDDFLPPELLYFLAAEAEELHDLLDRASPHQIAHVLRGELLDAQKLLEPVSYTPRREAEHDVPVLRSAENRDAPMAPKYMVQMGPAWVRYRTLIPSGDFMMDSGKGDEVMRLVVFLAVPVPD